ncbi:MAG: hypothetical protein ACQEWF_12245 [Bacillota bacterium]
MKQKIIVVMVSFLLVFSLASGTKVAQAQSVGVENQFVERLEDFSISYQIIEGHKAKKVYKQSIKGLKKNNISVVGNLKENSDYTVFESIKDQTTIVRIDLTEEHEELHGLMITYKDGKFLESTEMLIKELDETTGIVQVYKNGNLTTDKQLDIEPEQESDESKFYAAASPLSIWNQFTDCLLDHGVATWVINAIEVTCMVTCVASAGTACVACASGSALFLGGKAGWCFGKVYHANF